VFSVKKIIFIAIFLCESLYFPTQNINPVATQVKLSPEEVKALNIRAEKDLNELAKIYSHWIKDDILRSTDLPKRTTGVSFEKLDGILDNFSLEKEESIKDLDQIFCLFPENWILDLQVFFEEANKPLSNTSAPNRLVWGEEVFENEGKKFIIRIYPDALTKYRDSEILDKTIAHEIAHANDWRNNKELNTWEKVEFFKSVAARYNAKDRYHEDWADKYLSGIKFDSEEETAYNQIMEYWAIIVSVYISQNSKDLPAADQAIVKSILERTSPGFDQVKQKASLRQGIWDGILTKPRSENHNISIDRNGSHIIYTIKGGTITK
jgi:hypothetical protein